MPLYNICGHVIDSDIVLSLSAADRQRADHRFQVMADGPSGRIHPRKAVQQHVVPDGSVWMSVARHPLGYRFHFPALADFYVSQDGRDIRCSPAPSIPGHTIEHLLLDQVLPRVMSHHGRTVLHASAMKHGERAIIFLGDAGWGKSTLTASFCGMGLPLITDDCLLLDEGDEQVMGVGSYPGLRLWPDSLRSLDRHEDAHAHVSHYSSKQRLGLGEGDIQFYDQPLPVGHIMAGRSPTHGRGWAGEHSAHDHPGGVISLLSIPSASTSPTGNATRANSSAQPPGRLICPLPRWKLSRDNMLFCPGPVYHFWPTLTNWHSNTMTPLHREHACIAFIVTGR